MIPSLLQRKHREIKRLMIFCMLLAALCTTSTYLMSPCIHSAWADEQNDEVASLDADADIGTDSDTDTDASADTDTGTDAGTDTDTDADETKNSHYRISFDSTGQSVNATSKDLFGHNATLLPGDVFSGSVTLENSGSERIAITFMVDTATQPNREEAETLLDKATLIIHQGSSGESVYAGTLRASSLSNPLTLATLSQGQSETLYFEVSIPAELGNEFALAENSVFWIFGASALEETAIASPQETAKNPESLTDEKTVTNTEAPATPVSKTSSSDTSENGWYGKTGVSLLAAYTLLALLFICGIRALFVARGHMRERDKALRIQTSPLTYEGGFYDTDPKIVS